MTFTCLSTSICQVTKSKVHVTWKVTLPTCQAHFILLTCPNASQALQNLKIRLLNVWNFFLHFPHFCSKKDCPHLKHFMGCLIKRKIQPHFFGLFDGQLKLERGALSSYPLEFLQKIKSNACWNQIGRFNVKFHVLFVSNLYEWHRI